MNKRPYWRLLAAALCAALLFFVVWTDHARSVRCGDNACLGVPILSEAEFAQLGPYSKRNLSSKLYFCGEKAAVDAQTMTIYIPQMIAEGVRADQLEGTLEMQAFSRWLCFAPDPAWDDLEQAVRDSHAFTLLAVNRLNGEYSTYAVIFTPYPVLRLQSNPRMYGQIGLLTLIDPQREDEQQAYRVQDHRAQWRRRGGATAWLDKMSLKLRLCNGNGTGKNAELLGLGADDDWILNPMVTDDTKLRERFAIAAYNALREQDDAVRFPMTQGRCVEMVIDGEYRGLYYLCRRVDRKYLGLDAQTDRLFKGNIHLTPQFAGDAYDVIYSPYEDVDETYDDIKPFFRQEDMRIVNVRNWIDIFLFVQMGAMSDNMDYKNMFYVVYPQDDAYAMDFIPWDTDMSFGMDWSEEAQAFVYNAEEVSADMPRMEYEAMKVLYPDLDERIGARWRELRKTVWTDENLLSMLEALHSELESSGALQRDQQKHGLYSGGEDTYEKLRNFLVERMHVLDVLYMP